MRCVKRRDDVGKGREGRNGKTLRSLLVTPVATITQRFSLVEG